MILLYLKTLIFCLITSSLATRVSLTNRTQTRCVGIENEGLMTPILQYHMDEVYIDSVVSSIQFPLVKPNNINIG